MHDFISKINDCHDTIKFTFNHSNQEATFLDVNIKMKENGALDTSVHEKFTNCHQYIEFASCHPLSRNRTFLIARLNVTDVLRQITHVLKKILTD